MESDTLLDRLDKRFETQLKEAVLKEVRSAACEVATRLATTGGKPYEYTLCCATIIAFGREIVRVFEGKPETKALVCYAFESAIGRVTREERDAITKSFVAAVETGVYDKLAIIDSLEKLLERNKEYFV